jgi:hypothetical protein
MVVVLILKLLRWEGSKDASAVASRTRSVGWWGPGKSGYQGFFLLLELNLAPLSLDRNAFPLETFCIILPQTRDHLLIQLNHTTASPLQLRSIKLLRLLELLPQKWDNRPEWQ